MVTLPTTNVSNARDDSRKESIMLIATVNGRPERATYLAHKDSDTRCPTCREPVLARCGAEKVWHWAHQSGSNCPAAVGETEWHLSWKNLANDNEIEVCLPAWPNNRADICLDLGDDYLVVELQHSGITASTIKQRETIYQNMVWVVDVRNRDFYVGGVGENLKLSWRWPSKVWAETNAPVIFDDGISWYVWLKAKWRRSNEGWNLFYDDSFKSTLVQELQRPENREELLTVCKAAVKAVSETNATIVALTERREKARQEKEWIEWYKNMRYSWSRPAKRGEA